MEVWEVGWDLWLKRVFGGIGEYDFYRNGLLFFLVLGRAVAR